MKLSEFYEMSIAVGEGLSHHFRGDDDSATGPAGGSVLHTEAADLFQTESADDLVDEGYP